MNGLQQFFQNVFEQSPIFSNTASPGRKAAQLPFPPGKAKYGDFELTEAIRPARPGLILPQQGYRHDLYRDDQGGADIPVIIASASREQLFSLFVDLVSRLGSVVDVVLESSHDHASAGHVDFYREHIDMPVLISLVWEFEDLLLNDGCTGIAVLNPATPQEIQFDEHKLLMLYGRPLERFEYVLERHHVPHNQSMRFLTEAEHVHASTDDYRQQFNRLRARLGIDCSIDPSRSQ